MRLWPLPLIVVPGLLQLVSARSVMLYMWRDSFSEKSSSTGDLGAKVLPSISGWDGSSDCLTIDEEGVSEGGGVLLR